MQCERRVDSDAPPEVVWDVWSDVVAWPEFVDTVQELELAPPRLVPGARVRIRQPHVPADVWTVVDVDPGHAWSWEARGPGVTTVATHRVQARPDGTTMAVARVVQAGIVGTTVGWAFGPLVARYLTTELDGLRQRAEEQAAAGATG